MCQRKWEEGREGWRNQQGARQVWTQKGRRKRWLGQSISECYDGKEGLARLLGGFVSFRNRPATLNCWVHRSSLSEGWHWQDWGLWLIKLSVIEGPWGTFSWLPHIHYFCGGRHLMWGSFFLDQGQNPGPKHGDLTTRPPGNSIYTIPLKDNKVRKRR